MDPICRGLDGVMEAYRKTQTMVTPLKESKLSPVINYVTRMSHRSGFRGLHYHVLALFTRGEVTDLKVSILKKIKRSTISKSNYFRKFNKL